MFCRLCRVLLAIELGVQVCSEQSCLEVHAMANLFEQGEQYLCSVWYNSNKKFVPVFCHFCALFL